MVPCCPSRALGLLTPWPSHGPGRGEPRPDLTDAGRGAEEAESLPSQNPGPPRPARLGSAAARGAVPGAGQDAAAEEAAHQAGQG